MNKVDLLLQMLCLEFWSKCYKVNPDVVFLMNGLCGEQDYNSWWSISCIDFGIVRWGHVLTAQPGTLPFCIHACKAFGSITRDLNVDRGKKLSYCLRCTRLHALEVHRVLEFWHAYSPVNRQYPESRTSAATAAVSDGSPFEWLVILSRDWPLPSPGVALLQTVRWRIPLHVLRPLRQFEIRGLQNNEGRLPFGRCSSNTNLESRPASSFNSEWVRKCSATQCTARGPHHGRIPDFWNRGAWATASADGKSAGGRSGWAPPEKFEN